MALNQLSLKVKGDDQPLWQGVFEDKDAANIVADFIKSQRNGEGAHFPLGPGSDMVIGSRIAAMCTLVNVQGQEAPAPAEDPKVTELEKTVEVLRAALFESQEHVRDLQRGPLGDNVA
jgi:hypothetical protein